MMRGLRASHVIIDDPWAGDGRSRAPDDEIAQVHDLALAHLSRQTQARDEAGARGEPVDPKRLVDSSLDKAFWKVAVARPRSPLASKGVEAAFPAYSTDCEDILRRLEAL